MLEKAIYIQDNIDNIAMESDKEMVKVASRIKWKITDSCPSKLFTADDILLQQVKNDNILYKEVISSTSGPKEPEITGSSIILPFGRLSFAFLFSFIVIYLK